MAKKKTIEDADLSTCPNCDAQMNSGDSCPECDHSDDESCTCDHCLMCADPTEDQDSDDDLDIDVEDEE